MDMLSFFFFLLASIPYLVATKSYPAHTVAYKGPCHNISAIGESTFCSFGLDKCIDGTEVGHPGQCKNYGDSCKDANLRCAADEVDVGVGGLGGRYGKFVNSGDGICEKAFGNKYPWEKYKYETMCCSCPTGYVPTMPSSSWYCPTKQKYAQSPYTCSGCKNANDVLSDDHTTCVPGGSCPTLTTVKEPHLVGYQAVVSTAFEDDVRQLVVCARSIGASVEQNHAGLSVQSSSRCGLSPPTGHGPAKGTSAHQLGRAIDADLILPSGNPCDFHCMGKGYCAFNKGTVECVNGGKAVHGGLPTDPDNILIRDFFTCAKNITGLGVGATFKRKEGGDFNHFQRDVKNRAAALREYQVELKTFCQDSCEGVNKGTVSHEACHCSKDSTECCLNAT